MLFEEVFTTKRHPFRLGMTLQVILTEIWSIVRRAVFARDHHDVATKAFFAQRLCGCITGRAGADNHKLSRVGGVVALDHRRRASIASAFRHTDENSFALDAHVIAGERVECRRLFRVPQSTPSASGPP